MTDVCRNGNFRLIARCFLETKAYEHESWPGFVERTKAALLETPEERWNDQWLRDLHLFNVVVRDQQQCASYTTGDAGLIDLGEFYACLVAKQQNSLTSLLSAYASQDAAAAFRLAEVCHLDILRDCPTVIVNNLDQGPFFELVLHAAFQDNERLPKWCIVVSEAALRSSPVALKLCELPPNSALDAFVSSVPRKRRWGGRRAELPLRSGCDRGSQRARFGGWECGALNSSVRAALRKSAVFVHGGLAAGYVFCLLFRHKYICRPNSAFPPVAPRRCCVVYAHGDGRCGVFGCRQEGKT